MNPKQRENDSDYGYNRRVVDQIETRTNLTTPEGRFPNYCENSFDIIQPL